MILDPACQDVRRDHHLVDIRHQQNDLGLAPGRPTSTFLISVPVFCQKPFEVKASRHDSIWSARLWGQGRIARLVTKTANEDPERAAIFAILYFAFRSGSDLSDRLVAFVGCSFLHFSHLARTALRPCSLNSSLLSFFARARPPFLPSFAAEVSLVFAIVASISTAPSRLQNKP